MSFVMRLGWPGFRPSLLPFWNFARRVWISHNPLRPLRTLRKQIATNARCDFLPLQLRTACWPMALC